MSKVKNEGQVLAKARDRFFRDRPELLKSEASGQFLKNRIERAFIAGWNARQLLISKRATPKKRKKRV